MTFPKKICEQCGSKHNVQIHHLFSNSKVNRKLYGELLDAPENLMLLCESCHLWKPIPKFTELEFCQALNITPRSKQYGGSNYLKKYLDDNKKKSPDK
jgi:5-methylcytosine-specific restriction endonuclease McrA